MLFTILSLINKWISLNYEHQISKNVKFRINILGVIVMINEMFINQGSANGVCGDRLE